MSNEGHIGPEGPHTLSATSDFDNHRGARIRTGDLCVPNAALYRTEPRPGTAKPTSESPRGLTNWPNVYGLGGTRRTDGVGFEPTRVLTHTISNRAP